MTSLPQNIKVRNIGVQWLHGLIAPTCGRPFAFGAKLGYEVTLVRRATYYLREHMHAALDVNIASYASAIVTTKEVVKSISALQALGTSA